MRLVTVWHIADSFWCFYNLYVFWCNSINFWFILTYLFVLIFDIFDISDIMMQTINTNLYKEDMYNLSKQTQWVSSILS